MFHDKKKGLQVRTLNNKKGCELAMFLSVSGCDLKQRVHNRDADEHYANYGAELCNPATERLQDQV